MCCYHAALALRKRDLWIALLLFAAVLMVYTPVRTHQFIRYDDPVYITDNRYIRDGFTWDGIRWAFTSVDAGHWMPLTWMSHMLDCELFGLDAGGHHLISVFIHAASTAALFLLLLRITAARWPSAFAALVFGLHPLHVESVAWAAERKDVLSALFSILTLWVYAAYAKNPSRRRYAVVVALFAFGLLSKSMLVTLPLLMLLLDYWPLRRKMDARVALEKIPLLALSIAMAAVVFFAQKRIGAVSNLGQLSLPLRTQNAAVSYAVYILKFFWPVKLALFYPHPESIPAWKWLSCAAALTAVTAAVLVSKRRYLVTGWLWYLGSLAPVIGLVQVGAQARADHFTYIPLIGLSIMIGWLAAERITSPRMLALALTAPLCVWIPMTISSIQYWENSVTVFQRAIDVTEKNWIAYNNLGVALRRRGDLNGAISNFQNAVALQPDLADIQVNLGEALVNANRFDEATVHLQRALQIRPGFSKAHVDLGTALLRQNRTDEAAAHFHEALLLDPSDAEAHFRLGGILASEGRLNDALPHFNSAIPHLVEAARLNPNDPESHHSLGGVLGMMGRLDEAIAEFAAVERLRPSDPEAHYNLALALASGGRSNDALPEFDRAIRLKPDYIVARFNFAKTLAAAGRNLEAEQQLKETLEIAPDFEPAKKALASLH
jgi:Flp pilus assembly protein TadD